MRLRACKLGAAALLGIALAAVVTLVTVPAGFASGAAQDQITFNASAQHAGTGAGGGQTQVALTFTRWSTEEERQKLKEVFFDGGMQALADYMRTADPVGFIRAPSLRNTSWRLRYAIMFYNEEGMRVIRAATDRPVSFREATDRMVRTWDYNVALMELTVDEAGNGEGWIRTGVEFVYNEEDDSFLARNMSSQPIRLNNVRFGQ